MDLGKRLKTNWGGKGMRMSSTYETRLNMKFHTYRKHASVTEGRYRINESKLVSFSKTYIIHNN
jgi:hypothetical protein